MNYSSYPWITAKPKTEFPPHISHTAPAWHPEQESNLHLKFRKLPFYPLNYRGGNGAQVAEGRPGLCRGWKGI